MAGTPTHHLSLGFSEPCARYALPRHAQLHGLLLLSDYISPSLMAQVIMLHRQFIIIYNVMQKVCERGNRRTSFRGRLGTS